MQKDEVCHLLDKLTLEMLRLIEDRVKCQINIENAVNHGNIHLAKSRYIMGQNSVSSVQLPTENSADFLALSTVERSNMDNGLVEEVLTLNTRNSEMDTQYVNPIKWFGILVPQNLHQAQNSFKSALSYIIESVNIQRQLDETCKAISVLKKLKVDLAPEE